MRLSIQLYTVRDALKADFLGTLTRLREIGLEYVELAGDLGGGTAAEAKAILDDLGLKVSGAHVPLDRLRNDLEGAIAELKALDCPYAIVPFVGEDDRDWEALAATLTPIGKRLKEAGLVLAYHNHDFEFPGGGFDTLYAKTNPNLLQAELDLAWIAIAGHDPVAILREHAHRTPLVHLKDYDPNATPRWRPAGEGVMDWAAILPVCEEIGVRFGMIELDESPGDPLEAVATSYGFLKAKGLG